MGRGGGGRGPCRCRGLVGGRAHGGAGARCHGHPDDDDEEHVAPEMATSILNEMLDYGKTLAESVVSLISQAFKYLKFIFWRAKQEGITGETAIDAMSGDPGEENDDVEAGIGLHRVDCVLFNGTTDTSKKVTKVRKDLPRITDPKDPSKTKPACEISWVVTNAPIVVSDPLSVLKVHGPQIPTDQEEKISYM